MFSGGAEESPERYRFETVPVRLTQKAHDEEVQKALNEGAGKGWELVSASSGAYVTALFWDTTPRR